MAARSIASLTISFGLVAIPVKLYSATVSSGKIRFHMLHRKDGSRLRQQYICQQEGVVVARDEIVKGYEFAKDQYVTFTPEEIKALEEAGTGSVEVTDFVPIAAVDPVYFDTTYWLAPDKGGAKPYTLFNQALRERGRCAVGRWATRGRDHVVVLRPVEHALALHQLHFAPEVRPVGEIDIPEASVREQELKLAQQLIDQQSSERFDPAAYRDETGARIEAAIQRKVEGHEISLAEPPRAQEGGKVIDLMQALRASLERSGAAGGERDTGRRPAARADARRPKRATPRRAPRAAAPRRS